MIAIELVHEGDANQPDPELTQAVVDEAARNGLILLSCGIRGNVIRLLPPLTITDELIGESMDLLEKTFDRLIGASG
jgi:4-aminobutyrate aminotransferase/(S)-3-amino-2-methylpropionate transaminase